MKLLRFPLLALTTLALAAPLRAQDSSNVSSLDAYDNAGSATGVFVTGNYAYVACGSAGLYILDVTDPSSITFEGRYNSGGVNREVFVSGNYAYLADGGGGLVILDVSDPTNPSLEGSYDTPGNAWDVVVRGDYAYVADDDSIFVIDVSDPTNPSRSGAIVATSRAYGVALDYPTLYVADYTAGLRSIDVTDPENPGALDTYNTPGRSFAVALWRNIAFVADYTGGMRVIDISDPSSLSELGSFATPGYSWDVELEGEFAFLADRHGGLRVVDVTDPTSPTAAGHMVTPDFAYGVFAVGTTAFVGDNGDFRTYDVTNSLGLDADILDVPFDYLTIQDAIDNVSNFGTVLVHPGRYIENVNFTNRVFTLSSLWATSGSSYHNENTVIDGSGAQGSAVKIEFAKFQSSMNGFTITGGSGDGGNYGGGVYLFRTELTINGCIIEDNNAGTSGGGLHAYRSDFTLTNSTISSNNASYGGGMYTLYSDMTVQSCLISSNTAGKGAGIFMHGCSPAIEYCEITDNDANTGRQQCGGVFLAVHSDAAFDNCTIANNTSTRGGGGITCFYDSNPVVENSIFWGNSPTQVAFLARQSANSISVNYTDIQGGLGGIQTHGNGSTSGANNLNSDPSFSDDANGDYTLSSALSPCVDSGDPGAANDPDGTRKDMGAHYYDQSVAMGGGEIALREAESAPTTYGLDVAYPNPFNAAASIPYRLPEAARVTLRVYDLQGRLVTTLVDELQPAGYHLRRWDAAGIASGYYFVRMQSRGFNGVQRVLLLK